MKHCCDYIKGLKYKLQMMGIPCDEPAYIEVNNQSVICNTTIPDSTLKKKSQGIAYHMVREEAARDEWRTDYINMYDNEADLIIKQLSSDPKRRGFVMNLIHHISEPDSLVMSGVSMWLTTRYMLWVDYTCS